MSTDARLSGGEVGELVLSLGVKVFRRVPNSPLDARERALVRLAVRPATGRFTAIVQLYEVPGVAPEKFDSIKSHARI